MMCTRWRQLCFVLLASGCLWILASCSNPQMALKPSATETKAPSPTVTLPPTPTPIPYAALVNGEGIYLSDYLAEILRLQDAQSSLNIQSSQEEQKEIVLTDMINQVLLAQAAVKEGYSITENEYNQIMDDLVQKAGGKDAFEGWLSSNHYDWESFTRLLKISLASAWQRDRIIAGVPLEMEQVSVLQILVYDEALAQSIHAQLINGADFSALAFQYDPQTGGWLGWFPKGYLFLPEIEETAFSLQPGTFSDVVKTAYGYHILYLIEKEAKKPLSVNALKALQQKELENWLKVARDNSEIQIIHP